MVKSKKTLLRLMEDQRISKIKFSGVVLDVGGGGFDYLNVIRKTNECRIDSVNISPEVQPTFVSDLNKSLQFESESYDNVICFNTIEHIFRDIGLLCEILRVLKSGGRFVITAPYLFPRHGKYSDFHRHTAEFWETLLVEQGLNSNDFVVEPLVVNPLSSALATLPWFRGGRFSMFVKLILFLPPLLSSISRNKDDPDDCSAYALGYFINGKKA